MVRNRSFTVPQSVVSMYQLEEYARPMVGRSVQVNSLCFTKRDWKANVASEAKAHLLVFTPDAKENGNEGVKSYLESGEAADIDKGYKTSIRDQWWVIPSIKLSSMPPFAISKLRWVETREMPCRKHRTSLPPSNPSSLVQI